MRHGESCGTKSPNFAVAILANTDPSLLLAQPTSAIRASCCPRLSNWPAFLSRGKTQRLNFSRKATPVIVNCGVAPSPSRALIDYPFHLSHTHSSGGHLLKSRSRYRLHLDFQLLCSGNTITDRSALRPGLHVRPPDPTCCTAAK